jgi:hypothetical protein
MKQQDVAESYVSLHILHSNILQIGGQRIMSPMRVAIAGTCGLALLIAREIQDSTSHQLVILSRTVSRTRQA